MPDVFLTFLRRRDLLLQTKEEIHLFRDETFEKNCFAKKFDWKELETRWHQSVLENSASNFAKTKITTKVRNMLQIQPMRAIFFFVFSGKSHPTHNSFCLFLFLPNNICTDKL